MGRLGHAYTCPASPNDCSSWTTDLGFVYSVRGELAEVWELTPHSNGAYYHVSATYWANGLINTLNSRLGSLPTWTYNPEGEGRVTTVSDSTPQTLVSPTSYNLYGLPTGMTFGSTDYDTFQYDAATGRMTQFAAVVHSSSMTATPTWNANGSLQQLAITDGFNANNTQTCTYQHDDLARIAAVNCPGKWSQSFTYGSNGFGNVNWTGSPSQFTQTYDPASNHFNSFGSYNANGYLTGDITHNYTWDADGELYQIVSGTLTTTMTYDALGRRVEQAVGGAYTEIVYGPGGSKLALVNGSAPPQAVISAFIPLPAGATAVYAGNTLSRYRHSDWLGSSRFSSTPAQPTSVPYDGAYSPMGESYVETGTMTDRNFTGQNQDLTTGSSGDLYDFAYREYHPIHGRWISPDPAGLGAVNQANPQSWNRYAYVNGSPLNRIDPHGLCSTTFGFTAGSNCPDNGLGGASTTLPSDPAGIIGENYNWYYASNGTAPAQNFAPTGAGTVAGAAQAEGLTGYTTAPNSGLSNQGGIFQADIGAMHEFQWAALWNELFWAKLAQKYWSSGPQAYADLSGGAIQIAYGAIWLRTPFAGSVNVGGNGGIAFGLPGWGGFGSPLTLSFAPGPTFTAGTCPPGYHWQFDPSNTGAGACYLTPTATP